MSIEKLIGREVHMVGADHPLDPSYRGVIRAADAGSNSLLVVLLEPSHIGGKEYPFAVARPRGGGEDLIALIQHGSISCTVTWVPGNRYNPAQPFDLSWWRGGAAATADLILA